MPLTPRRALGALLLLAAYAPAHRLLDPATTGLAGSITRATAEQVWTMGLWGTALLVGAAGALAVLVPADPHALARRAAGALRGIPARAFAVVCGATAFALSAVVAVAVLQARPTTVDEMVQLLHARAVLAGAPALPLPGDPAAWMVQNSYLTPAGWASIYPPFHTLLLALGLATGSAWWIGPASAAVTATFAALSFDRLLPGRPVLARGAAALGALAPFFLFLSATHLSHGPALAFATVGVYAALRARDGSPAWSVLAGAAVGALVCTRPWTGVVVSVPVLAAAWLRRGRSGGSAWVARRAAGLAAGGLLPAALLLAWNQALTGSPWTLGYAAAYGPTVGLGFGSDLWGNAYGPLEALAYSGADLLLLGASLLESPLPAVALVGAGLLLARALPAGSGLLLAWALGGLVGNAFYWHHGIHMGPRMLLETAPAWVGLWVLGAAALAGPGSPLPGRARRAAGWAALLSLAAGAALVPGRAGGYRADTAARIPEPAGGPPGAVTLVFAHGSWGSRVSARLAAAGMRRDSLETALRRNDLCTVDAYARWRRRGGTGTAPPLDFEPLPGPAPHLRPVVLSPGNAALLAGGPLAAECAGEAAADRLGTVELEPLLWQAPPLPGRGVVVARDLGPEENEAALAAFPGASAWVLLDGGAGRPPRLQPYAEAMATLWGGG